MRPKVCENCGSNEFHKITNGWKCDYCQTEYIEEIAPNKNNHLRDTSKRKSKKFFLNTICLIVLVYTAIYCIQIQDWTSESITDDVENNVWTSEETKKDINQVAGWTQKIFDDIQIGTEEYNNKTDKYSYSDGDNYQALEALVGKPHTRISWEEEYGQPPREMVEWSKLKNGDYAGITVSVTYDKTTFMIIDKDAY